MVETAKRDEGGGAAGRRIGGIRPVASPVVTLAAVLAFTGCSSVPDALNPVEWYEGTTDTVGGWFSDEEPEAVARDQAAVDDSAFPNLSTVPQRPTPSTTEAERSAIQQGLVADRDNARYTDSTDASAPAAAPRSTATIPTAPPAPVSLATKSPSPGATSPATPQPSVAPTPARTETAASRVAPSGDHSSLWPRRPAPERSSVTPVTSGRVTETQSAIRNRATPSQTVSPEPRPRVSAPTPAETTTLDSAGSMPTRAPQQTAAAPQAPAEPAAMEPAATLDSAPAAAADQSPSVIVDSPSLDQYQLGFSGPAYLVGTVNFGHGSAGLSGADREMVAAIAAAAQETDAFVRVVGHASARTAEMSLPQHELVNFDISLARAQAVAAALIAAGVPEQRVLVEAMSASQPLYFESMPSGEAGNRRAEILFQY